MISGGELVVTVSAGAAAAPSGGAIAVYDGVAEITAGLPVRLSYWENTVASGNMESTGTLRSDLWVDEFDRCIFGSVHAYGRGYVALLAANVSIDAIAEVYPDNTTWLD